MATPLHTRGEVGLRPPRSVSHNVASEGNTVHYGGPSPWGSGVDRSSPERFTATADHARCASIWRAWQAFHMDTRGWQDIAYSSGVCPHGHRYEGRGPGVRTAANGTTDGNNRSLATCYIAGDNDPLTDAAKLAFLDEGRRLARLRWGHRDWKSTACPGTPLYTWRSAGWPAPTEEDLMPALSDAEQREVLRLLRQVHAETAGPLPDSRLAEVTILARVIAGIDPLEDVDIEDGGEARQAFKTLIQGSMLDGIRERHPDHPDRGDLREPFKRLVKEAIGEMREAGEL